MRGGIDTTSIKVGPPKPKPPRQLPQPVAYWSLEIEAKEKRRREFRELHQSMLADILKGKPVAPYY